MGTDKLAVMVSEAGLAGPRLFAENRDNARLMGPVAKLSVPQF